MQSLKREIYSAVGQKYGNFHSVDRLLTVIPQYLINGQPGLFIGMVLEGGKGREF